MKLFRKRKYRKKDDLVFKTDQEKLSHFSKNLIDLSRSGKSPLAFVHFKDSVEILEQTLIKTRHYIFRGTWDRSRLNKILTTSGNEVFVITADFLIGLQNSPLYLEKSPYSPKKLYSMVFEHYPIITRDKIILDFLQNLPVRSEISFYVSLEEPLLSNFTSDQLISLIEKMGFNQGYIQSHLLTSSIESVQKKIEKKVKNINRGYVETSINSSREWFKYNFHQNDLL